MGRWLGIGAGLLIACIACARGTAPQPAVVAPPEPAADYWLVADPERNVLPVGGDRRLRALRTVPVPVVSSLGVDISLVRHLIPAHGRLMAIAAGSRVRGVPIVPGRDRYVLDASAGFNGLEPYQWGAVVLSSSGCRKLSDRCWQTKIRAVPRFEERFE